VAITIENEDLTRQYYLRGLIKGSNGRREAERLERHDAASVAIVVKCLGAFIGRAWCGTRI